MCELDVFWVEGGDALICGRADVAVRPRARRVTRDATNILNPVSMFLIGF